MTAGAAWYGLGNGAADVLDPGHAVSGDDVGTTASSRAHSFNAAADQYAASRPSYPPALFDSIEQFTSRPLAGARVADVGAGTGIATALLT